MATGEHRPVLVPRLAAVWELKLVKDHVLHCRIAGQVVWFPDPTSEPDYWPS